MPIQLLLTLGLLGTMLYTSMQRVGGRLMRVAFAGVVVMGVYFVWLPDHTTAVAQWLGVGRGTDLLIYLWILLSLLFGVSLHLKVRSARAEITELTRALALSDADEPQVEIRRDQVDSDVSNGPTA